MLGRAVELRLDESLADLDGLSQHYRGEPYPRTPGQATLTVVVAAQSWSSWGRPGER